MIVWKKYAKLNPKPGNTGHMLVQRAQRLSFSGKGLNLKPAGGPEENS